MAKSTSPHNGSGVFSTLQELTAEFVLNEDGRVIEDPSLPSATSRNPVPRGAGLALDRTDRGKAGSSTSEAQDFAAEIESLRIALQRLQLAFSCTTTIEERVKRDGLEIINGQIYWLMNCDQMENLRGLIM